MIHIYIFITGNQFFNDLIMYTACAITSKGKWLAGAVSCVDTDTALERCRLMTIKKAKEMLSSEYVIEIRQTIDSDVDAALKLAFENMP